MRRELFCAVSLSGLLLACAHDKAHETAERNRSELHAESAPPEGQAQAEGTDDKNAVVRDQDRVARDNDGVEVPKRRAERDRMATAGDELPARDADKNRDADNTGVNKRDRDGAGLTPLDQGNSEIDLDLTQRIRKAVVSDDSLSFSAKNVKIITRDGHVTLRGSVKSAQEKEAIGRAATMAAGPAHVTNQLDVAD